MAQSQNDKPVGVSERKSLPFLSGILSFLLLLAFYFYQSAHSSTWITSNTFQIATVVDLFGQQKFADLARLLFISNFATVSIWQLLLSIYFICLFAIPVEKRLGPGRFLILVFLACTLPWCVQFWDVSHNSMWPIPFEHPKINTNFFGPASIAIALASAYMVLVPKKEKDRTRSRFYRKDRIEIFNRTTAKPVTERFGLSSEVFFFSFIVAVFVQHYCMLLFLKDADAIGFYAGLTSAFIGYAMASFIRIGLEDTFSGTPLKHAAIKQYYELMDLDVSHDNAVKGAAKGLGLPDYQVEEWVKKTKGKLRPN